jgi:alpha-beta hydrolase superfamily lysophospholipase
MNILKNSIWIIFLTLTSCGIFIKQPRYERHDEPIKEFDSNNFFHSDGSKYFVRQSIFDSFNVIIICIPGLGGHAGNYNFLQDDFSERKISTIAVDLRGFGHWTGRKGDVKNIGLHINDINQIVDYCRNKFPGRKILLLGESLGSSLCLWYSSFYPGKIDGLILTSLVTKKGMDEVKFKTVFNMFLGFTFCPGRPVLLGFDPSVYSNDQDLRKWLLSDTLGSGRISARYLMQSNNVIKRSYKYLCTFGKPAIILQGGRDFLSDKKEIKNIMEKCESGKLQYEYFPDGAHSLVNDLSRKAVFNIIVSWVKKYY